MPKKKGELSIEERLEQSIVAKEEEPYKLSSNWVWTRLGDITEFIDYRGKTPTKVENGIPLITAKNIKKGYINEEPREFIKVEDYDGWMTRGIPQKGDVAITTEAPLGNVAQLNFDYKFALAQRVITLTNINFDKRFLFYSMLSTYFQLQLKEHSTGSTVEGIKSKLLKTLKIAFPPLEEQKRIVEKLDSLFEKIQKIKEIIEEVKEKTTSRREAILSKAFSGELTEKWRGENKNFIPVDEILLRVENEKQELIKNKIIKKSSKIEPITENDILFDIPQSWKRIKLNDIAFVTKLAGFEYTKNIFPNLVEKGIPLFKGKNVQDGKIVYEFESYIPESISDELPRSQITKKCLLTPYVGTIGNIALFEGNFKAHLGSNVGKIEVFNNFNENILEKYLLYYFRSCYGLAQLKKHRKATAQESISIEAIRDCVIILPPLEEQKEIVRVLDKIFEEENRISELISLENKIEILEKTILDRAFRGELGTGNSDDEPAIELLKKCLEER